jgi:hypothetical protein
MPPSQVISLSFGAETCASVASDTASTSRLGAMTCSRWTFSTRICRERSKSERMQTLEAAASVTRRFRFVRRGHCEDTSVPSSLASMVARLICRSVSATNTPAERSRSRHRCSSVNLILATSSHTGSSSSSSSSVAPALGPTNRGTWSGRAPRCRASARGAARRSAATWRRGTP